MAIFCFWGGLLTPPPEQQPLAVTHCTADIVNNIIGIEIVIDGDTVLTDEGETIRLIGIDTPEMNYDTGQSEPLALTAKQFLESLLTSPGDIGVVFDEERQDQYGRTLAHLFLPDGRNIQQEILGAGLAVPFSYPPNLGFTACYYEATAQAQQEGLGVWGLPALAPVPAAAITGDHPGYRVISGEINQIIESEQSLTFIISRRLFVIIPFELMNILYPGDIKQLLDNQIQLHGYVYQRGQNYGLRIHHPSQIRLQ